MAVSITHAHVATGTDAGNGEVHKSEWNAAHTVSGAADLSSANNFTAGDQLITGSGAWGYGTGSGGAVTQSTSKATGVTINKTSGQITTNAAALAGNTIVLFNVANSTFNGTDTVIIHRTFGGSASSYIVWVDATGAGTFNVNIRNMTAGSLSESITLNFAIIRAITA